jgi:hypothetical protein
VGEPVVAGLDASAIDQHLRIGGQAGKRAAQMFVHLKNQNKCRLSTNIFSVLISNLSPSLIHLRGYMVVQKLIA